MRWSFRRAGFTVTLSDLVANGLFLACLGLMLAYAETRGWLAVVREHPDAARSSVISFVVAAVALRWAWVALLDLIQHLRGVRTTGVIQDARFSRWLHFGSTAWVMVDLGLWFAWMFFH